MAPPVLRSRPKKEEIARDKGKQPAFNSKIDINPVSSRLSGELGDSMLRLEIDDDSPSVKATTESESNVAIRAGLRFDDEQTYVSSSSTKPASLDGKSTASGATFALDEKESLRPDDSASAKAAEEDDSYSGPGSGAPSSRVGSEAGGRAFRDQFNEISERIGHGPVRSVFNGRREIPGIEEEGRLSSLAPNSSSLPPPVTMPGAVSLPPNGAPYSMEYKDPDEKLLEALTSPKDRLFVLRLEHDIITFIQDPK